LREGGKKKKKKSDAEDGREREKGEGGRRTAFYLLPTSLFSPARLK